MNALGKVPSMKWALRGNIGMVVSIHFWAFPQPKHSQFWGHGPSRGATACPGKSEEKGHRPESLAFMSGCPPDSQASGREAPSIQLPSLTSCSCVLISIRRTFMGTGGELRNLLMIHKISIF